MSVQRRPHAAQPGAVGRADLLRFFQHEADAQLRAQATALLGLPPLPMALFEPPSPPPPPQPPPPPVASAAVKSPLRCPALLHARPLPAVADSAAGGDAVAASSTATRALWTTKDADEVENMLLAPGPAAPAQMPLVPFARRAGQVARARRQPAMPAVDWPALLRQVAQGQLLWPLPLKRLQRVAPRLVLLLDVSPALGCFEEDFWGVAQALGTAQGWPRTEVWLLPDGPDSKRLPAWEAMAQRPWDKQTVLVVLSDLGAGRPAVASRWQQHLRVLRRGCGRLVAITPCAQHHVAAAVRRHVTVVSLVSDVSPPAIPLDEQRRSLMAALAPALTVEPSLIRAMRQTLLPGSTPLLERDVWLHADLVGGLPSRQWLPQRQRHWLEADGPLDADRLLLVQRVLHQQHAHCCQVQRDEEAMLLASWLMRLRPAVDDARLRRFETHTDAAQVRCARVARHLRHLEQRLPDSGPHERIVAAHTAGSKAGERLQRMPVALRQSGQAGADELFKAQALDALKRGAAELAVPDGVRWDDLPPADAQPLPLELWQQGQTLRLQAAANAALPIAAGQCLLRFELVSSFIEVQANGQRRVKAIDLGRLPMPLWRCDVDMPGAVQVRWHGGGFEVLPVARPRGASAWGRRADGAIATEVAMLASGVVGGVGGKPMFLDLGLSNNKPPPLTWVPSTALSHVFPTSSSGLPLAQAGLSYGFDVHGAFAGLVLAKTQRSGFDFPESDVLQRFRYIEPGTFLMGSPATEARRSSDEGPQHPVTITQGYWLADTPCTQALWMAVMGGKNPSDFTAGPDADQRPVEQVSWDDVQTFLKRLRELLPAGCTPALPTEAEWEYAARAGTTTAYAWGDEFDVKQCNTEESGLNETTPAKRYAANDWGLYDIHGNVWEWCADALRSYRDQPEVDPSGDTEGDSRVLRGGSWSITAGRARSAFRALAHRGSTWRNIGFRLALRSLSPVPGGPSSPGPGGPAVLAGRRSARAAGGSPSPAEPGRAKKSLAPKPARQKKP